MKIRNKLFSPWLLFVLLIAGLVSCTKHDEPVDDVAVNSFTNLTLTIGQTPSTRGGGPNRSEPSHADVAAGLQLFPFSNSAIPVFSYFMPVKEVAGSTVKSNARVGVWNLVTTYFRSNPSMRVVPMTGASKDKSLLFAYTNSALTGSGAAQISTSAPEIFRSEQKVTITTNSNTSAQAYIARNVAMVQLVIAKSTLGVNKDAVPGSHKVYLHNVPSAISYGGQLLKSVAGGGYEVDADHPDTLATPLQGCFQLSNHQLSGYLKSDTVNFIIPAHQGSDFWLTDSSGNITGLNPNPRNHTSLKMKVSLDLERPGGSRYQKTVELSSVAQANKILRVSISVNAGVEVGTTVLDWNYVPVNENTGESVTGAWVYVKQGASASGTGLSWRDAVSTINKGIELAQALKSTGATVHGVLIAGGASRIYNESINISTGSPGIRLYGGWEGISGTELAAADEAYPRQPQTSPARKLATHKAVISGSVLSNHYLLYIDGLKITGNTSVTPLTLGANTTSLVANAIEITGNTAPQLFSSLSTNNPWLTNILIANNPGASFSSSAANFLMINATIVGNKDVAITAGGFQNCVFWGNTGVVDFSAVFTDPNYSASDAPAIGMVRLNTLNNGDLGPQFKLPKYSISGATSPLINNGANSWWEDAVMPALFGVSKDIDGQPRRVGVVDIGCYERLTQADYDPLSSTPVDWKSNSNDWGYVGTFHRALETTERLIVGPHTSGDWSAYIENGSDWISLDLQAAGAHSGVVDHNTSVKSNASNATTASGAAGIAFRVGLRSQLWGGTLASPRYGTIIVTWRDGTVRKQSRIYVRQGESDDYLFTRPGAVRFSPYNLMAATYGTSLAVNGGVLTQYPSQCGGYFQWMNEVNPRIAYAPSGLAGVWNNQIPYYETYWTENEQGTSYVLATNYETCPVGYRRVNDGATSDEPTGISEMRESLWANPASTMATNTFGGYYADGFFDRHRIGNAAGLAAGTNSAAGAGDAVAYRGRLFYNPSTNASLFFPAAGCRRTADGAIENAGKTGYYWSSSSTSSTTVPTGSTAYVSTDLRSAAVTIRCVKN